MKRALEYPIKAIFKSRKHLEQELSNPQTDGRYLLVGSVSNLPNYVAFYDSRKDKIILELEGKSMEELVEAGKKFFEVVDNKYKSMG